MNESELENELRSLRPAAPSRALEQRINESLAVPKLSASIDRPGAIAWWLERLLWCGGGAFAAWLFGAFHLTSEPVVVESADNISSLQPQGVTEEQIALTDEGVSMRNGEPPQRVLHRLAMERHTWKDILRGDVLEVQVPREDVIFLPVKMQ